MSLKPIPGSLIGINEAASIFANYQNNSLPKTKDGIMHYRDGVERHGSPPCVVISIAEFNDSQTSGLIVVPIISAANVDLGKFKNVPSTWVRVVSQGEPGFALVEQGVRLSPSPKLKYNFEPLIGSPEAAKLLGNIHVKTLQRYARQGGCPDIK